MCAVVSTSVMTTYRHSGMREAREGEAAWEVSDVLRRKCLDSPPEWTKLGYPPATRPLGFRSGLERGLIPDLFGQ